MADKNIGALPAAAGINADALFVIEQQGTAQKASGEQIAGFAKQSVGDYVKQAQASAGAAADSANDAEKSAETAKAAADHPPQVNTSNGYWQTWDRDTGQYVDTPIKAEGPVGPQGTSITDIRRTGGTGAPGTTDTYTIALSDGTKFFFHVYNGMDGTGAGDMRMDVYDPQKRYTDIFAYVDNVVRSIMANELTRPLTTDTGEAILTDVGTPILAVYHPDRQCGCVCSA